MANTMKLRNGIVIRPDGIIVVPGKMNRSLHPGDWLAFDGTSHKGRHRQGGGPRPRIEPVFPSGLLPRITQAVGKSAEARERLGKVASRQCTDPNARCAMQ